MRSAPLLDLYLKIRRAAAKKTMAANPGMTYQDAINAVGTKKGENLEVLKVSRWQHRKYRRALADEYGPVLIDAGLNHFLFLGVRVEVLTPGDELT